MLQMDIWEVDMPNQQQLDELRITNDEEAEEAIRSIRAAQKVLRETCKNRDCMNQRRTGSSWCQECAANYKLIKLTNG